GGFLLRSRLLGGAFGPRHRYLFLALAEAGRLADAVAEVVELGAADHAGALHFHLGDLRRVQRENTFHAFALHDAANGEALTHAFAAAGDHRAAEDLHAFFRAFEDALVHLDLVADFEGRDIFFLLGGFLDQPHQAILHD